MCEACVNDLNADPSTTTCEAGSWCDENAGACYEGVCSIDTQEVDCQNIEECGVDLLCATSGCTSNIDCRSNLCDTTTSLCINCVSDTECEENYICDTSGSKGSVCYFDCGLCNDWENCEQGVNSECTAKPCTSGASECALIIDDELKAVCHEDSTCVACLIDENTDPNTSTCSEGFWCTSSGENAGACYEGVCSTDTQDVDCQNIEVCGVDLLCAT
jgi:hypothetical protein